MSAAEVLQPFQRVLSWSQFTGAKDNQPDRHNGTWLELAEILTTVRKAPKRKDPADAKKAVPAFSGTAFFEGSARGCDNAESIHLLVFDFDNCIEEPIPGEFHKSGRPKTRKVPIQDPAQPEPVIERLKSLGLAAVVYTTWSHSPQLAKFRVVVPLQAPISPAYWTEATEWAMDHLGFLPWKESRAIDIPVLRDVARLNFLPCAPDPSTVHVWELKGKHLAIPEAALPNVEVKDPAPPAWLQPRPRVNARTGKDWWASYPVQFKTLDLAGTLAAMGVKVGKAQPFRGGYKFRCHCPWATEHSHGIDDDSAVIIQTPGDWPSFKCAHSGHVALGLQDICEAAGRPMIISHAQPYRQEDEDKEEASDNLPPAAGREEQVPVWQRLHRNKDGVALKVPANLAKILRFDPQWGPRLSLNEMSRDICHDGEPKRDHFVDEVQEWVQDTYGLNFGRDEVRAKLLAQCSQNMTHPVRRYLLGLPAWDGEERLRRVPEEILQADPHDLNPQYLVRWAVGAVRRVLQPGCKLDTTLVLSGPQGFLKSTFFAELAGEWFGDSPVDLTNKDGYLVLHQSWITELGEIDHLTSVQSQEKVKAFLSSRRDIFRAPYAASAAIYPRSCVIVGTTNRDQFLTDSTGSRRFWPIKVTGTINVTLLRSWRDQLWAEALNLERAGVEHWLESSMDTRREVQAEDFAAEDPWDHMVEMAAASWVKTSHSLSDGIPIAELMTLMGLPAAQQTKGASMKLATLLKAKGWKQIRAGASRERRWAYAS